MQLVSFTHDFAVETYITCATPLEELSRVPFKELQGTPLEGWQSRTHQGPVCSTLRRAMLSSCSHLRGVVCSTFRRDTQSPYKCCREAQHADMNNDVSNNMSHLYTGLC